MVVASYIPIFIFAIIAFLFTSFAVFLGLFLGHRIPSKNKLSPYECGNMPEGDAKKPFPVKFFLFAILFLLFDIETVFFFPWALSLRNIGWFGFCSMLVFVVILAVAYIFELKMVKF